MRKILIMSLLIVLLSGGITGCLAQPAMQEKMPDKPWTQLKISDVFAKGSCFEIADAAAKGRTKQLDLLVDETQPADCLGVEGFTPLAWAWLNDNKVGFNHLLQLGANPNQNIGSEPSSILQYIVFTDLFYLKTALAHGADPNSVNPKTGETLVYSCLAREQVAHLKLLLESGAKPNYINMVSGGRWRTTPLFMAFDLTASRYPNAFVLVSHGADPFIVPELWSNGRSGIKEKIIQNGKYLKHGTKEYRERKEFIELLIKKFPEHIDENTFAAESENQGHA